MAMPITAEVRDEASEAGQARAHGTTVQRCGILSAAVL